MRKVTLMGALLVTAVAAHLSAGSVSVTYIGANGQKDSFGYLVSPSAATVNGVSATVYCDSYANSALPGQTYWANQTNLGSGNLSLTRYGGISKTLQTQGGTQTFDAQQLYAMAAWLTTQFAPNSSASGAIQDTLWGLFNSNSSHGGLDHPRDSEQYTGKQPPISNAWLFSAENNYASLNLSSFTILTNPGATPIGQGQVQEFIFNTAVSQSPEPASMGLLGVGLMLLSIVGRRALFPKVDSIEYALIPSLISLAAVASMTSVASAISKAFTNIGSHLATYTS
jgi:Flp pilus assembly pilin Flp